MDQDKTLTCVDCGAQFTFSERDQAFYQERGYQAPRRCKTCRDKRKNSAAPASASETGGYTGKWAGASAAATGNVKNAAASSGHDQFKVQCSGCGQETTVPFKPDPNRPVYCRTCYMQRRK